MLLQKHESRNRVRPQAHKTRHPALEHPHQALILRDLRNKREDILASLGAHDASLDHINWTADGRRDEAGHEGGGEVGFEIIPHLEPFQQLFLEYVV